MKLTNYIKLLKLCNLFETFSNAQLIEFTNNFDNQIKTYCKNNIIHFESEKCTKIDIILQGEVLIQKIDDKGNLLTITQFNDGDCIGGNLLFSEYPFYPMVILANIETTILHIKKETTLQLCQNNKNFLLEFLKCISNKAVVLTNTIKTITQKSIRDLIIEFLSYEYYSQNNKKIMLYITKKELAERLGIQRTSLSRELNKMKADNLISYNSNSITIDDLSIIKANFGISNIKNRLQKSL